MSDAIDDLRKAAQAALALLDDLELSNLTERSKRKLVCAQLDRALNTARLSSSPTVPLLAFAVFDEFGKSADDRVQDYGLECARAALRNRVAT